MPAGAGAALAEQTQVAVTAASAGLAAQAQQARAAAAVGIRSALGRHAQVDEAKSLRATTRAREPGPTLGVRGTLVARHRGAGAGYGRDPANQRRKHVQADDGPAARIVFDGGVADRDVRGRIDAARVTRVAGRRASAATSRAQDRHDRGQHSMHRPAAHNNP